MTDASIYASMIVQGFSCEKKDQMKQIITWHFSTGIILFKTRGLQNEN